VVESVSPSITEKVDSSASTFPKGDPRASNRFCSRGQNNWKIRRVQRKLFFHCRKLLCQRQRRLLPYENNILFYLMFSIKHCSYNLLKLLAKMYNIEYYSR